MGCLSQKMSPLEVISTDQWNLSFFSAFLEQRMNKYGMNKLVEQRRLGLVASAKRKDCGKFETAESG